MSDHILVHVDDSEQCKARVQTALQVARRLGARLTGAYVAPIIVPPMTAAGIRGIYLTEMTQEKSDEELKEHRARVQESFRRCAGDTPLRTLLGPADIALVELGRLADLIVLGQHAEDGLGRDLPGSLTASVVMRAGRPVLTVPDSGAPSSIGDRVMLAWNNTRESTRALHDALPYLRAADKVIVHTVGAVDTATDTGNDFTRPLLNVETYLEQHDVDAELSQTPHLDLDIPQELLARLSDNGCDLLVMGAYGHSRLHEFVFGGTTRQILKHMTVPVLMSH